MQEPGVVMLSGHCGVWDTEDTSGTAGGSRDGVHAVPGKKMP